MLISVYFECYRSIQALIFRHKHLSLHVIFSIKEIQSLIFNLQCLPLYFECYKSIQSLIFRHKHLPLHVILQY